MQSSAQRSTGRRPCAWREYLGLTQAEVATRLGISQSAHAQQESSEKLRKSTREKIAAALGITDTQLDV